MTKKFVSRELAGRSSCYNHSIIAFFLWEEHGGGGCIHEEAWASIQPFFLRINNCLLRDATVDGPLSISSLLSLLLDTTGLGSKKANIYASLIYLRE